jgi:hypothetical protein
MLKLIELENFKAFGKRATIPLAPITLIYGQNSSGKSSILQALNLLKQSIESRDEKTLLILRTENGLSDLGSFQDVIFDHDLSRILKIRIDVDIPEKSSGFFIKGANSCGLEFGFSRKRSEEEITIDYLDLYRNDIAEPILSFEKTDDYKIDEFPDHIWPDTKCISFAKCTRISEESTIWQSIYDLRFGNKNKLLKDIRDRIGWFEEKFFQIKDKSLRQLKLAAESDLNFYSKNHNLTDFINYTKPVEIKRILVMNKFLPHSAMHLENTFDWFPFGNRRNAADISLPLLAVAKRIKTFLGALLPLGPFRKPPTRWYVFSGTTPTDVGYQGHLLPDLLFRNKDILIETNKWLGKLEIGYKINLRQLSDKNSDLFELRLFDIRRPIPVEVGLTDVGFGISQILPLIVQSLAASDQIITVEQPEVHIHPRLQADLGDLLIEATREPRKNQFIIETHSEHLALRLQRRVREKSLPPDQVSIIYVGRGPEGSFAKHMQLDENGDFLEEFPGGFFPERIQEVI